MPKRLLIKLVLLSVVAFAFTANTTSPYRDEVDVTPHYHVALFLPLHLHNPARRNNNDTASAIYDYYEGVELALRELEKMGMKLTLHVFDTEANPKVVDSIIQLPVMRSMHTILGPIYPETILPVSQFCAKSKIPLVSIFKHIEKSNLDSFPYINLVPSDSSMAFGQGMGIANEFSEKKCYILSDNNNSNFMERKLFREGYLLGGGQQIYQIYNSDIAELVEMSKREKFVVYCASDSIQLLKKLASLARQGKIILTLPKDKRKLKGFTKDDFIDGKVVFGDNNFFDKYEDRTLAFRKRYREVYQWEAGRFQFMGYDHVFWLGQCLMTFNMNYPSKLQTASYKGLMQTFSLRPSKDGSYENAGCTIVMYNENGVRELVHSKD